MQELLERRDIEYLVRGGLRSVYDELEYGSYNQPQHSQMIAFRDDGSHLLRDFGRLAFRASGWFFLHRKEQT